MVNRNIRVFLVCELDNFKRVVLISEVAAACEVDVDSRVCFGYVVKYVISIYSRRRVIRDSVVVGVTLIVYKGILNHRGCRYVSHAYIRGYYYAVGIVIDLNSRICLTVRVSLIGKRDCVKRGSV